MCRQRQTIISKRLSFKSCQIVVLCIFFWISICFAQIARFSNIVITNNQNDLFLYLTIEGAFREDIVKMIMSGVPTTFSFFISLHKVRTFWLDKEIVDLTVTHTIKYHSVKKEFVITRSWEHDKPIVVESFKDARKLMSEIESLKIIPLNALEKNTKYQIRAKAELSRVTLPYYLHYVLFFVSFWNFETEWYTIDFVY